MSYHILISEAQRAYIEAALAHYPHQSYIETLPDSEDYREVNNDVEYLHQMVKELPQHEAEAPGVLHGLSL